MRNFGTLVTALSVVVGCSGEHGGHGSEPSDPVATPSDAELVPAVIDTPVWKGPLAPDALANESKEAGVVQVTLEAVEADVEVVAGETVKLWTYNGVLPGPRIEARVGDLVRVHFKNSLGEATTIHWHGLRVPADMDGVPAAQTPIEPGGQLTYEFVAEDAGTFWYHPHVRSDEQVERGLYGSIVVRDDAEPETSSEATAGGPHAGPGGGGDATPVFSINGEVFPDVQPLSAVLGTTEEWTVTNTTEMDHPFHLHGFRFEVTDVDGTPPPFRALQDTINVGAMQTVTLRVPLEGHPGTWMFHCHILEHAERGMMGELDVIEP